jgi:hypothetical protein
MTGGIRTSRFQRDPHMLGANALAEGRERVALEGHDKLVPVKRHGTPR